MWWTVTFSDSKKCFNYIERGITHEVNKHAQILTQAIIVNVYFLYPPQTKLRGYIVILMSVRSFVRPSVRPSQSLIRYSSKTAEQNFMKLSGIVHYMMPYCTSYFKFLYA